MPWRVSRNWPVDISQRRIIRSSPPLASNFPSGPKATERAQLVYSERTLRHLPLLISQRRTAPSFVLASICPSGLKVTDHIREVWPSSRTFRHCPVATFHKRIV